MKKHFILAAMATTALLAGCSNEEENLMPNAGAKVSFVIDGPVTRTTTDADGNTLFANGDKINIYSSGLKDDMSKTEFTVNNGSLTGSSNFYFNGKQGATFYAYYPNTATGDATEASYTVTDQTTAETFNANDFMTATQTVATATADPITLKFAHKLALVKVALNNITATEVVINNIQPTATWTYNTDAVTATGDATSIKMWNNDGTYWAVVPAQSISTGTQLLTITTTDGKIYTYKPTNEISFIAGNAKKFNLGITGGEASEMVALSVTAEKWIDEVVGTSGTLEEKNYIAFASDATIATITKNRDEITGEASSWGFFNNGTAEQNNGKFSITANSTNSSWYNRTLYFYSPEELPIGEYTLSFNIKSTTAKQQLQISLLSAESNPSFYQVTLNDETLCTQYRLNMTTEDKEYQIAINTAKIVTTASPSNTEQTFDDNITPLKGFFLSIAFPNDTYELYNLKLIKK